MDESKIGEKKEGKYAKPLPKIQVTAIFLKQDGPGSKPSTRKRTLHYLFFLRYIWND